jgi:hypothetical protein
MDAIGNPIFLILVQKVCLGDEYRPISVGNFTKVEVKVF